MAQVEDYKRYTKLSRAINSSFGDQGPGEARVSTQKVNLTLVDENMLKAHYVSTVTFPSHKMVEQLTQKFRTEGYSMIEAALNRTKEQYEELFPDDDETPVSAGSINDTKKDTVSFEILTDTCKDVNEFLNYNQYTPALRAFFKMNCLVKIK